MDARFLRDFQTSKSEEKLVFVLPCDRLEASPGVHSASRTNPPISICMDKQMETQTPDYALK